MFTAVCLVFFFVRVNPKYIEGELKTSENWAFLTRFCFLSEEGQFEFHVEYNEDQGEPNLLLYYDSEDQWPAVYKSDKSCTEKEAVLKIEQNQIVNLTIRNQEYRELSGCGVFPSFFTTTSKPPNSKSTISVPTLAYKRRLFVPKTTEPPKISEEFWSNNSTWSPLPDFTATAEGSTVVVENVTFSEIQEDISYVTKASREKRALLTKSPKSDVYVKRGRTIVCHNARRFRSSRERWWFIAVSNCNGHKVFDPGEVLYLYESPAGYGLIILKLCAWCMFIYSTIFTLKRYPEKANFYYPFNICGTLWFIAGPAFILSANSYIDKWVRESIVCAVLLFITFSGHLMFLLLTMPSVANKNFPYHVRTSQIGVMELTGSSGNNTIEQFGHHVYEPAGDAEQTVIIPLTRRTEEIFGTIYSHQGVPVARQNGRSEMADEALENVLSWSLAKNLSMLDMGGCAEWRQSHGLDIREANHCTMGLSRRSSTLTLGCHRPLSPPPTEPKEVPLELFTVSRIVSMKNKPNEEET